ncbi:MAG: methyltransferase domain-containing protein [Allosphingosinicella sp.]
MSATTAAAADLAPSCQGCGAALVRTLVDLGEQPLANSYIPHGREAEPEPVFPLHARVCDRCLLVQVDNVTPPETIFNADYAYYSSFSESWLAHCRHYAERMSERFGLDKDSLVVEIASNDGYMLQYFVAAGIPVLGIEPAAGVAAAAEAKGVPTVREFFGLDCATKLARQGRSADLLAAKNVLAHVPDINDFVAGIPILLKPEGVFTVEFPHLLNLIRETQFDTIYHEHFTYLSLLAVQKIFARHGLTIFDVERLPTHGGSLRVFAARREAGREASESVGEVIEEERAAGLDRPEGYAGFEARVRRVRADLLQFLAKAREEGSSVAAYGAAAKGNTLLNYCGVTRDQIDYVVDRNPAKQQTLLPGSRIPVRDPAALEEERPDYLLILPWNLRDEIIAQNAAFREQGGRFVTAIPRLAIF